LGFIVPQLYRRGTFTVAYLEAQTEAEFLSPRRAARLLGCSTKTILEAIRQGRLPATRVSQRTIRVPANALKPFTTPDSSTSEPEGGDNQ
jgi:excisionase family DNA binding protein